MDIYSILASKPHNPHYLKRYIRFVSLCQEANSKSYTKLHKHHICPRAKDMFPEYTSFATHKWNLAKLTPRQHFIAHILLWKAFPNSLSQMNALWQMKHKNNETISSRLYETLSIDYAKSVSNRFQRMASVYDTNGE